MPKIIHITNNLSALTREETLGGVEYLVVPMVMITEGVHNGSSGPLYYPAEELEKFTAVWNHKPVVVYHPEINGQGVSACSPEILESHKVGMILNTKWEDGKLKAEAWLEKDRMDIIDNRITYALATNQMMEVSTGLFSENEVSTGEWNGEQYVAIARNYRPDHLAILPDLKGACSIEDGAGLLRNAKGKGMDKGLFRKIVSIIRNDKSHSDLRSELHAVIRDRFESNDVYPWIEDVFDNYFIAEIDGKLYRYEYSVSQDGVVSVGSDMVEVIRETTYKVVQITANKGEEADMKKNEMVASLIDNQNTPWTKEDESTLMAMDEAVLAKIIGNTEEEETEETTTTNSNQASVTVTPAPVHNEEEMTAEQWLEKAPKEIRDVIRMNMDASASARVTLIEQITANTECPFTKEQLEGMDEATLLGISKMSKTTEPSLVGNYSGLGNVATPTNNSSDKKEEAMTMPVINFEQD